MIASSGVYIPDLAWPDECPATREDVHQWEAESHSSGCPICKRSAEVHLDEQGKTVDEADVNR